MATETTNTQEYPTSYTQAMLDTLQAQGVVAQVLSAEVAEALFAPVRAALVSDEDEAILALAERYGANDEAVARGWVWQSAGFGTD